MKTRLLNRLLAIQGFAVSMLVSIIMLATFAGAVSAQTDASSASAQTEQSSSGPAKLKSSFNHTTTGFPLTGAHLTVACETCHVNGNFSGTPRECAGCHTSGRMVAATPKNQNHIQTTQACNVCHTSAASFQMNVMDHSGVTQPCSTCHNGNYSGIKAMPSDPVHAGTTAQCNSCHKNTASFTGSKFDHIAAGATNNCATCHNGSTNGALAKPVNHIATTAVCELCHTSTNTSNFTSWLGATFDHSTIGSATCSSCHGGQTAGVVAKPASHISTTLDCGTCHTSTVTPGGFVTWTMNHTGITSGCASCHTGTTYGTTVVMGKPSYHIATTAACEQCHTSTITPGGFATWTMNHAGITSGCASCHSANGDTTVGTATVKGKPVNHIPYPSTVDCGSCHSNTSTGGFVYTPPMNHSVVSATSCATCHDSGKSFYDLSALVTKPSGTPPHIPIPAGVDCASCHGTSSFTSWSLATVHSVEAGTTCATCHGTGAAYYDVTMVTYPANHATLSGSATATSTSDCSLCHSTTTFLGAVGSHTSNPVPTLAATCTACHGGGTPGSVGTGGGKNMTANHIPIGSLDCSSCHTYTSFTTWTAPAVHTAVSGTACSTCHNSGLSYSGVVVKPATHIPYTAGDCSSCHTLQTTNIFWYKYP